MNKYPIDNIRSNFPMINKEIIYLDNASSTYKPISVINIITNFYKNMYSSYGKNTNYISIENKNKVENVRKYISKFINSNYKEIIFTTGSTDSINLVADFFYEKLNINDNIFISIIEHHSNILPWYNISNKKNIKLNIIPILNNGELDLNYILNNINKNTKIISISHISNVLGIENPIEDIIRKIRLIKKNIIIIIDGSQSISHIKIDVKKIDCDFYIFSGHKIYSSYGIGILYGKIELLNKIKPCRLGGSIVKDFNRNNIIYLEVPWRFEPGSINISSILSLGESIKFIENIGIKNIYNWEKKITNYAINLLKKIPNLIIYGKNNKNCIISFNIKNINYYDIEILLNKYNISIRSGNHCAIPLMENYNVKGMCRISFALYTSFNDINIFINKLKNIINYL